MRHGSPYAPPVVTEKPQSKPAPRKPGPWWTRRPDWLPPGRVRWLAFILLLVLAFLGYDWFRLSSLSSYRYAGQGWKFPTQVYADWRDYRVGDHVDATVIQRALDRAQYRRVWKIPADPGQYRIRGTAFEIHLRPFTYPDHVERGSEVVMDIQDNQVASLGEGFAEPGPRGLLRIDPEILGEFSDQERERRSYIPLAAMPRHLVLAVVASEDRRFFRHWGLDLLGMGRATVRNLRAGGVVEGGSTISQQLVKNLFLSRERNVWRKFHEALLAVMVELRYSKEQILEFYLNQIYLGQRGSWSVCGVEEGSLYYFNKHVQEITPAEAALLVGIIPAPNKLSPYRDPEAALARRDQVLVDMVECGFISKQDAARYRQTSLRFAANAPPTTRAPYFVDYVRELLAKDISESDLSARGFSIFTTLDGRMQEEAERIARAGARDADARSPIGGAERSPAQASLVAIEPSTGYIRAMVGGRNYAESPYNRAVDSRRQPGSAFKPFVYAAALDSYFSGKRPPITAATLLRDQPDTFQTDLGPWSPKNFENSYAGQVTVARALARSLNVATVRLSQMVGLPKVIEMARSLGIESRLRQVASLALGTSELSVLELTTAYATLANGGVRVPPIAVKAVLDRGGNVRWSPRREGRRVIRPETAYLTTILLEGPVIYGTASAIRSAYGFMRPAAGKTGTTDDENDAWFIGYSPDLATGVWVGCDRNRRIGLTGTAAAVPIWARFMQVALQDRPFRDFEAPEDVVDAWIDGDTGYRAGPDCLHVMRAAFIRKTEPRQLCPVLHMPFWSDSLAADSTGNGEPTVPPDQAPEQEPPPSPPQPTSEPPSGDAAGAGGAGVEPDNTGQPGN
ncbi:MAG: PBP1A family penicillin-binding protein [Candidatus Eisenbacteria bacterium]|uniref:PBP1A family penicillin-binding protein n=1 Tax=Eiseniibacteriota bacterium TaxID=2212470 RepID=A0A538TSZ8_UNCEI|nr:MAG: PBP1A family penicillin-binding protein [Candidatus Eisenbacteria bacterium]